ncbi:MAG TPA: methyltransferase domain-containing protein [Anaerolineae bacterium]
MARREKYIPALGHDWLTPLYDPLLRWVMREETFKRRLIAQADIQPGQRVLDLGCGTATLTILIKQVHPDSEVVGVDADVKVLDIGRAKASKAGVDITLDHGMAFQLPYPDRSFDRVLSSLVLHHLTTENKRRTLSEVFRVLRPGGELHVVDFGKPHKAWGRLVAPLIHRLERAADNVTGRLPAIFREAGFDQVEEMGWHVTAFGSLSFYRARKSAE